MGQGVSAQGTKIAWSIDPAWVGSGSVAYTDIAELKAITPPPRNRNVLDLTTHNEEDEQIIVGIRRSGDFVFNLNFVPDLASHDHVTGLQKVYDTGERRIYRITYPTGDMHSFSGFITNFAPQADPDTVLTAGVTVKPTGKHTMALG